VIIFTFSVFHFTGCGSGFSTTSQTPSISQTTSCVPILIHFTFSTQAEKSIGESFQINPVLSFVKSFAFGAVMILLSPVPFSINIYQTTSMKYAISVAAFQFSEGTIFVTTSSSFSEFSCAIKRTCIGRSRNPLKIALISFASVHQS
jgi:hypothetical protein